MKKRLLGYYDYTVVLTYLGAISAVVGIFLLMKGNCLGCLICLMTSGLCDMFDGLVASTKSRGRAAKRFGIQIDSLSDLIAFGVLPGLFVYCLSGNRIVLGVSAVLFILCALIRLAYFNVLEEERQEETDEARHSYLGVPVTTIAVILPALYLLYDMDVFTATLVFAIAIAVLALGFIVPVHIKKPGTAGKVILIVVGAAEFAALVLRFALASVK